MKFPKQVNIVEVGPRDGLQNEQQTLNTESKLKFIKLLAESGLNTIEATSFVSPKKIPQLSDAASVMKNLKNFNINLPVLVPNRTGMEQALESGAKSVAVFTSVSETFTQKNTNCSISESLDRITEIITIAEHNKIPVRGYISCTLGCPYEGSMEPKKSAELAVQLLDLGCYEISLGDTIGVGTPVAAKNLILAVAKRTTVDKLAVHFHDTYGQALANIYAALEEGICTIDSSVAGLGGCPYARGASGNVATEDVLYMLDGMNIETGVNLDKLLVASEYICKQLKTTPKSKVAIAKLN